MATRGEHLFRNSLPNSWPPETPPLQAKPRVGGKDLPPARFPEGSRRSRCRRSLRERYERDSDARCCCACLVKLFPLLPSFRSVVAHVPFASVGPSVCPSVGRAGGQSLGPSGGRAVGLAVGLSARRPGGRAVGRAARRAVRRSERLLGALHAGGLQPQPPPPPRRRGGAVAELWRSHVVGASVRPRASPSACAAEPAHPSPRLPSGAGALLMGALMQRWPKSIEVPRV